MFSERKPTSAKHPDDIRICGVEGGCTQSSLIVMDGLGRQLVHISGPSTNHWGLGMVETAFRINEMMERAKESLGIAVTHPFDCAGLCLSGCEEQKSNEELIETIRNKYPNASAEYVVASDTVGSLKTGSNSWGIVLIAGTGSNAVLFNSDGSMHSCGGWGHMMGDEGAAFWIAHKAAKYVFDELDGLEKAPHAITYVWPTMRNFFGVSNRNAMLPHLYSHFQKHKFAMLTKELATGCESNDPLCLDLFTAAGKMLAKHVNALATKANNDLKLQKGGLRIICVGSVWKSWEYLKRGFTDEIQGAKVIDELTLMKLIAPSAIGACYTAGEKIACGSIVKATEDHTEAFFHYKRNDVPTRGNSNDSKDPSCQGISIPSP